jgi:hypothetical protein
MEASKELSIPLNKDQTGLLLPKHLPGIQIFRLHGVPKENSDVKL